MRPVGRMAGCGTGHHSGHPRLGTIVQGSLRLSTLWGFRGSDIPFGTRACPTPCYRGLFPWRCPWHQPLLTSWGKGSQGSLLCPAALLGGSALLVATVFLCPGSESQSCDDNLNLFYASRCVEGMGTMALEGRRAESEDFSLIPFTWICR